MQGRGEAISKGRRAVEEDKAEEEDKEAGSEEAEEDTDVEMGEVEEIKVAHKGKHC